MRWIDRSRIQAFDDCRRLRYWKYEHAGTGISLKTQSLPLLEGTLIHEGLARLGEGEDIATVAGELEQRFVEEVEKKAIRNNDDAPTWFVKEQQTLLRGMLLLWGKWRLPELLKEYTILTIEADLAWGIADDLTMGMKCDMILERLADGAIFILEFKTLSMYQEGWLQQWENNSQLLSYVEAVEELLQ